MTATAKKRPRGRPPGKTDQRLLHIERYVRGTMLGESYATMAQELGLSDRQSKSVRDDPLYKQRLAEAMQEQDEVFQRQLKTVRSAALRAHVELLMGQMKGGRARDRLRAAESILDRAGAPRQSKVEQTGNTMQTTVNIPHDFLDKTPEELLHFASHGEWPAAPVVQRFEDDED